MDYDYNRDMFRHIHRSTSLPLLVRTYGTCVLLELSLKQHLGLVSTAHNAGHDLPQLIRKLGQAHPKSAAGCNALQKQLADSLKKLYCQGRGGTPQKVPPHSYPYMRYLRHANDWPTNSTIESDIVKLDAILQGILTFANINVGVSI